MELPSRPKNDRYTPPGRYNELERQLRFQPGVDDIPTLVCYAFDYRTRLGPFLFADTRLLTAGPRAVAAALHEAGFTKTRIVLRQWTPNFRVSEARLDGRVPELLLVSSMQIHSASAYEMIRDAYRLGDARPFILAGGAKAIYEPWDFFGLGPNRDQHADVAVTGEEYVILELLDRLMEARVRGEHLRKTFHRMRRSGLLDDIPGLVFREGDEKAPLGRLINTGMQRLVQNLDELPSVTASIGLLEPPHTRRGLSRNPVAVNRIHKHAGHDLAGHHARLQVPLPLLPDPGLQPVHLPLQIPGTAPQGHAVPGRKHRHPRLLRHRRQLLQQPGDGRGGIRGTGQGDRARQTLPRQGLLRHRGDRIRRFQESGPAAHVPGRRACGPSGSASRT